MDDDERTRTAAAENYEIDYLVMKSGITRQQSRDLVKQFGHDREMLMKHVRKLRPPRAILAHFAFPGDPPKTE